MNIPTLASDHYLLGKDYVRPSTSSSKADSVKCSKMSELTYSNSESLCAKNTNREKEKTNLYSNSKDIEMPKTKRNSPDFSKFDHIFF